MENKQRVQGPGPVQSSMRASARRTSGTNGYALSRPSHILWRTVLLAMCAALSAMAVQAQTWAPEPSRWTYAYWSIWEQGHLLVEHSGTVEMGGLPCQVLQATKHVYDQVSGTNVVVPSGTYHTHADNGLVRIWTGDRFDTLYHFNAVPGEGWRMPWLTDVQLTVLDTGHVQRGGVDVRFLEVAYAPAWIDHDTIFERFGALSVFINPEATLSLDAPILGLRCYTDAEADYIVDANVGCTIDLGVPEAPEIPFTIGPNPTTGPVTIQGRVDQVRLITSQGALLRTVPITGGNTRLALDGLAPGLYWLRIRSGRAWQAVPIIKE